MKEQFLICRINLTGTRFFSGQPTDAVETASWTTSQFGATPLNSYNGAIAEIKRHATDVLDMFQVIKIYVKPTE